MQLHIYIMHIQCGVGREHGRAVATVVLGAVATQEEEEEAGGRAGYCGGGRRRAAVRSSGGRAVGHGVRDVRVRECGSGRGGILHVISM